MKNIDQGISETIECDVSRLCLVAGVEERSGVKVKKEGKKGGEGHEVQRKNQCSLTHFFFF